MNQWRRKKAKTTSKKKNDWSHNIQPSIPILLNVLHVRDRSGRASYSRCLSYSKRAALRFITLIAKEQTVWFCSYFRSLLYFLSCITVGVLQARMNVTEWSSH